MYKIVYHRLVFHEDFKKLSRNEAEKILKSINKKLTINPESYGKPLTRGLQGYYRLRVEHYRVIYRIDKDKIEVLIIKIGLRKDFIVYLEAAKRLKLL